MAIKVLVLAEIRDGENLTKSTREALGLSRRLVENSGGGEVAAVLPVQSAGDLPQSLAAWGADRVLVAESAEFGNYSPGGFAASVVAAVECVQPAAIIVGGTAHGKDLTPRLSARLSVPATTDCIGVEVQGDNIYALRPAYGGKVQMKVSFSKLPAVLCIRPNVFETVAEDASRSAQIENLNLVQTFDMFQIVVCNGLADKDGLPDIALGAPVESTS